MRHLPLIACVFVLTGKSICYTKPQQVSYDGYKVVRLHAGSENARVVDIIQRLALDTWQELDEAGAFADIVIPPERLQDFELKTSGMEMTEMHQDLGASIAAELKPPESTVFAIDDTAVNTTWFTSYHLFQDHLQFLEELVAQYPNNSEVLVSGKSHQGNDITAIRIYGSHGKGAMPAVVFHGTVHGREWITTMVVEYVANFLLANYDSDPEIKDFVDKYDFYLYPVVNPDGFTYTQTDRLWRKNRQRTAESTCIGHDINRNWPYMWHIPDGASDNPCAQDFKGMAEADAPETKVLQAELLDIQAYQGLQLFIDWHAYSQVVMTPYGYSCSEHTLDDDELQSIARGAAEAMTSFNGNEYQSGRACSAMYKVSGTGIDYAKDMAGGKYVFAVELPDTGRYGFLLPPAQILPTCQEALEGVKYVLRSMK